MKKKSSLIMLVSIIIVIIVLWISGIIPKKIAKVYANNYMENNFPEMQLEYVNIEWNKYHGDYLITYTDKNNQKYGCVIGPKYLPISIGQGVFAIQQTYLDTYKQPIKINQKIAVSTFIINSNSAENSISTSNITINTNLLSTYRELINSRTVQNEVRKEYPNAGNIELETLNDTGVLKAIYICDNYSEAECIKILNKYIKIFGEKVVEIYNINNISILDSASITTRLVEK